MKAEGAVLAVTDSRSSVVTSLELAMLKCVDGALFSSPKLKIRSRNPTMAAPIFFIFLLLLLFLPAHLISPQSPALGVGINYGQIANNLPSPSRVAVLLDSINVKRVKLYDADPNVLRAFAGTGVDFIIGLGNEYLLNMTDPIKAQDWIELHLQPFVGRTKISCIVVGNEVFNANDTVLMTYLLPAMETVYQTLYNLGLSSYVTVTSAHTLNILQTSYPPSAGTFREELLPFLIPLLDFHARVGSAFLVNAYPFFAYMYSPNQVPIEYVLFEPNPGMVDPANGLHYDNMLFAQIDAVYAAISAAGHNDVAVRISETGWPSKGDLNEAGANRENAQLYNRNLLRRIGERQGTPAKPDDPIDVFVFALFNENMKPGPTSERNYGMYYPDGTPVYDLGFRSYLPELISVSNIRVVCYPLIFVVIFVHSIVEIL